jgi:uncharacterized membrane-anchored protein
MKKFLKKLQNKWKGIRTSQVVKLQDMKQWYLQRSVEAYFLPEG